MGGPEPSLHRESTDSLIEKLAVTVGGLLLDTVHWYSPRSLPVTVNVWVYWAVMGSSKTIIPPEDCLRFSGPHNSCSRGTSGDTGEGKLKTFTIEVRLQGQLPILWYYNITCSVT